jgi:hypothetical protein
VPSFCDKNYACVGGLPASSCFARRREVAAVIRSELPHRAAALLAESSGRCHLRLAEQIIRQGKCRPKVFSASSGPVLWQLRSGFHAQIGVRDEITKGMSERRCAFALREAPASSGRSGSRLGCPVDNPDYEPEARTGGR